MQCVYILNRWTVVIMDSNYFCRMSRPDAAIHMLNNSSKSINVSFAAFL